MTDPITREIVSSSLVYASEEMGIALRNSSYSPNIKERMDHSAALFDSEGRLLAQAEHIPVHLGSLPWGLKNTIEYCDKEKIEFEKESMIMVNNPYISGTHLNDVTVVKPIFSPSGERLVAFAANKAHHSDVGGKVPGSISVDAKTIFEEGHIINPVYLLRKGEFVRESLSALSSNSRTPTERLGDLKAQVAANITGERRLLALIEKYGLELFNECCESSFDYASNLLKKRLSLIKKGTFRAKDYLEHPDGKTDLTLVVKITLSTDKVEVDYTGTDSQVSIPLNAVFGVTLSGVHYVIRTLTGKDIPPNHGAFSSISVFAPSGTILNPTFPFPVAAGNVETSQRNADLLYKALSKAAPDKVPAAAGGSMNNVMIGGLHNGKGWAFYETAGVGLGASATQDGEEGIQANMTNTMNTPIEEVERTLPLLVSRYEFREDSSGSGKYRGGSGLVRAFTSKSDSTIFTIVAERGRHAPWGLKGGKGGGLTRVVLTDSNGKKNTIPVKCSINLRRGETVEVGTAGGGGYGSPSLRRKTLVASDIENGFISKKYARNSGYTK
ncbi:MAG: hydantoinase B/oxoprolinase family protein [Nitrososphaerales archaeon]